MDSLTIKLKHYLSREYNKDLSRATIEAALGVLYIRDNSPKTSPSE